jgi:hypothetical protein
MKKYILIPIALFSAILFLNFNNVDKIGSSNEPASSEFSIPSDVKEIIDNSCYGCHNSESRNLKGKGKLKFDQLGELKTHKLVGTLSKLSDEVKEGDMPPKKFLKNNPESALTDEQKQVLINWAESTAKSYTE